MYLLYFILIIITVIVQSIINSLMEYSFILLSPLHILFINTFILITLTIILFFGLIVDILIWASVLNFLGVFPNFQQSVTQCMDFFTTLGVTEILPSPWQLLGPIIALNGIVIIAFSVSFMFNLISSKNNCNCKSTLISS